MKINFRHKGDFRKIEKYLNDLKDGKRMSIVERYAQAAVDSLRSNTPVDSGLTASSWGYELNQNGDKVTLNFTNSSINQNIQIAVILQFGHGTGTGGWVEGRDYINPALQPVFDNLVEDIWREVTGL